jgi:hypothetical protein
MITGLLRPVRKVRYIHPVTLALAPVLRVRRKVNAGDHPEISYH